MNYHLVLLYSVFLKKVSWKYEFICKMINQQDFKLCLYFRFGCLIFDKEVLKLHFKHYRCMVIILFSTMGLYKYAFSTNFFGKNSFSSFCVFCFFFLFVLSFEFDIISMYLKAFIESLFFISVRCSAILILLYKGYLQKYKNCIIKIKEGKTSSKKKKKKI